MSKETPPSKVTRRDFIKGAGTVAVAGALTGGTGKYVQAATQTQKPALAANLMSNAQLPSNAANILFVVVDQERFPIFTNVADEEIWPNNFDPSVELPWHTFLRDNGVTFTNYHTNTALCTPSRSVIYTGQHVPKTGMFDNHSMPYIGDMNCNSAELPTIAHMLGEVGYYSAYKGKWHLSETQACGGSSDGALEPYGFLDYQSDGDKGNPLQGFTADDDVAAEAADWLANKAPTTQPWFLAVNFTNPHDVMYYDPDDTTYDGTSDVTQGKEPVPGGFVGVMNYDPVGPEDPGNSVVGIYRDANGDVLDSLQLIPEGSTDPGVKLSDLIPTLGDDPQTNQVAAHKEFDKLNDAFYVPLSSPADDSLYKDRLNYYINCIRDVDHHLGTVIQAVQQSGFGQNTIVIFTADHGEHCGAHGLVTKGPTMYKENFRCPLIVARANLQHAGETTDGLVSAVDLIPSILSGLGVTDWQARWPGLKGRDDIKKLVANPNAPAQRGRKSQRGVGMLFTWDAISHNDGEFQEGSTKFPDFRKRGQVRGVYDGRYKFGRYFSAFNYHRPTTLQELLDNNDLELYDTWTDLTEINNLADPNNPNYDTNLIMEMNDKLNLLLESEVGPESADEGNGLPIPHSKDFFRVGS